MRKLIILSFISLDGVMQGPGGPTEDTSGDFTLGGWTVPYFDEVVGEEMGNQMSGSYELLLGRKTFDIFASYWPEHDSDWPTINTMTKYCVSTTLHKSDWAHSVFLKNVDDIKELRKSPGPDLQVHGSGALIQTLLKHDLVDELWLKIFPITLGKGKRLFGEGVLPAAFQVSDSKVSPSGVIMAKYKRAGELKTGSF